MLMNWDVSHKLTINMYCYLTNHALNPDGTKPVYSKVLQNGRF